MSFFPRDLAASATAPGLPIQWEEANCLLCGGRRWSPLVEAPETEAGTNLWFAVVQCQDCSLHFTNPRPSRESIRQFYPTTYRPHGTAPAPGRRSRQPSSRARPGTPRAEVRSLM